MTLDTLALAGYARLAHRPARAVARGRVRRWIDRVVGTALIAAGVSVLRLRRAVQ